MAMIVRYPMLRRIAALLVLAMAHGQGDFGGLGGDMFGGGGECAPFRCGKGQTAVQKRPLKLESTGCSGLGGGMQMFSADKTDDGPVGACCDVRNACVQLCGASRAACDTAFERCANATDDKSASLHVLSAKLGGCKGFDAGQAKACRCVETAKAAEKREQVLGDFYEKHNKAKKADVPKLAAKADNGKKFVALLTQLIGKYPKAIKRVKDPQQAWFEEMMNKADGDMATPPKGAKKGAAAADDAEPSEDEGEVTDLDSEEQEL